MFKYVVIAVFCVCSSAAAPGYLGGLAAAPAPAISYGHALSGPSIASYGLAAPQLSYAAPALAHGPVLAHSSISLGPKISYASPALAAAPLGLAHAPLRLAHAPLGLAHAPLGLSHGSLASPYGLGLGYRSIAAPALSAPALGLAHGW
ncbi:cuticle protein 12.5 [Drosophila tropicalis]|uniref:cuticle protein 12.5 n=1 Tax=Drosophila tropicalis TaxID=46794 RepID=UPI0035ABA193